MIYPDTRTPVYILSGFLGSGKTTLLQQFINYWKPKGLRPAVIMNEVGDVNLDGLLVQNEIPMAEMLSGCICCSIKQDLAVEMSELIRKEKPDVVIIEATGIANPMEVLDAVAEAALYLPLRIQPMITVVDAPHLLELAHSQKGKSFRLMQDQIRCGSTIILNKVDRVEHQEQQECRELLGRWNTFARIVPAIRCNVDLDELITASSQDIEDVKLSPSHATGLVHPSHEHVTVFTYYFEGEVDSNQFESFIKELPRDIYRGKGVVNFTDTASRFLFQYAYRELDYMKISPDEQVPNVAVFIGEHFDKQALAKQLEKLEIKK
ncbi:G3E family GTPase [Paenibacillus shirakamiensis]|uniref:G3E family GTPase n=1 Tax=Paenibacillus shirakamiensis TaxID=1265935 RepID=A0ABS4JH38_9BACL|nr:GTP-binding protein [Paenibacillus shirakamiensis]MBP2001023.1 G3E family GTPase [Paenibacillus shirakamiensis]